MRLILIRHGDPDYTIDGLTEKGKREAALLAERAKNWQVDDVFTSPLGRAVATAKPCLAAWKKEAKVLDWAQEFFFPEPDRDEKGWLRVPWDFLPADWTGDGENFREAEWLDLPKFSHVAARYNATCDALDAFLMGYGYRREGRMYRVEAHSEKTAVIFCHFGISMILLSHLLNISAQTLLHGFYLAPTSVTVLNTEERRGDEAYFRVERLGDCHHLIEGGEPISESGYFTKIFQEPPMREHKEQI